MFPDEPVIGLTEHDAWLIDRYRPPHETVNYADLDDRQYPPKELIVEVSQAYFHLSLRERADQWFADHGFDLSQSTITKQLFLDAALAEFPQPKPVEPPKPKPVKLPKKGARYTTDDGLVEEIIKSLDTETFPNLSQATWAVVPRAQGHSEQSKFHRLYRRAGKVLEDRALTSKRQSMSKRVKTNQKT